MEDTFLTVAEIAELLKLNPQTIRNWIDRGELPAVRVGARRVRIRQSDLDTYLNAGATASGDTKGEPPTAAEEPNGDPWPPFRAAMAESSAALANEDHAELTEALGSLANAARDLAEALRASS